MALTFTPLGNPNEICPEFTLPDLFGKPYGKSDFFQGQPVLFMFICNHCPYVQAIENRLIQLALDLKVVNIPCVAICANDSTEYPEDSPAALLKRSQEKSYPFIYLHDDSQAVAKEFGAVCTPDFFLFDKTSRLYYRGRLDDSWKEESKVKNRELYLAAQSLIKNEPLPFTEKPSMGCSIKWKL